jgi:Capsular polysaccharide biosynthesis protein
MHSHLLPGVDDGAQSMEDSIQMIRELIDMGYQKIITTPHIKSDIYPNTPYIIQSKLKSLREETGCTGYSCSN